MLTLPFIACFFARRLYWRGERSKYRRYGARVYFTIKVNKSIKTSDSNEALTENSTHFKTDDTERNEENKDSTVMQNENNESYVKDEAEKNISDEEINVNKNEDQKWKKTLLTIKPSKIQQQQKNNIRLFLLPKNICVKETN